MKKVSDSEFVLDTRYDKEVVIGGTNRFNFSWGINRYHFWRDKQVMGVKQETFIMGEMGSLDLWTVCPY